MAAYVLIGEGFEEIEAVTVIDVLRRGGVEAKICHLGKPVVTGGHGIDVVADMPVGEAAVRPGDAVIISGGLGGVEAIEASAEAGRVIREAAEAGALLAAICAGPRALARLGLLQSRIITCFPGMEEEMTGAISRPEEKTVVDGGFITGRSAGTALDFALAVLSALDEAAGARVEARLYRD